MKKPNFFIVGQPKAGTRSLYEMLKQHPGVFMSQDKEPGFFIPEKRKEKSMTLNKYLRLFNGAEKEKAIGEASTNYIYSKTAPKEIKKFNSNAKIIIILRELIDFLRSLYQMNYFYLNEEADSFEKALEKNKEKYLPKTKYYESVKRFIDVFDKKDLLIIIYDDYKNDTFGTYKKICEFLGIDDKFVPEKEEGHSARKLKWRKLWIFLDKIGIKEKWVVKILPRKFWNLIKKFLYKKESIKIKPETEKQLKKQLKPEVEKINNLLHKKGFLPKGRDLIKEWGYEEI